MFAIKKNSLIVITLLALYSCTSFAIEKPKIKTHINNLVGISCDRTAQHCLALGFIASHQTDFLDELIIDPVVYSTKNAGSTWRKAATLDFPSSGTMHSLNTLVNMRIRCDDSGAQCHITGLVHHQKIIIYSTRDAGLHWTEPKHLNIKGAEPTDVIDMTCDQTGTRCHILTQNSWLGAPVIYKTDNAWNTWSSATLQKTGQTMPSTSVSKISCDSSGLQCNIIGSAANKRHTAPIAYTTDNGWLSWRSSALIDEQSRDRTEVDTFSNIHCDSTGLACIALRHQEISEPPVMTYVHVYTTQDGGLSWQKTGTIDNTNGNIYEPFHAFDCDKSGKFCMAVHSPVGVEDEVPIAYTSYDGGKTWTEKELSLTKNTSVIRDVFCNEQGTLCQIVGLDDPYRKDEHLPKRARHA